MSDKKYITNLFPSVVDMGVLVCGGYYLPVSHARMGEVRLY